jgi:arabinan endo-1,5-alpha-L-arabinosidase
MKNHFYAAAIMIASASWMAGCGGGSGSSAGTTSTTTTTDMGSIVNVDNSALYSYQYQIKNAASGMVLGISGQSQLAGANIVQESNTSSTDSMWHLVPNVYADDRMNLENMLTHQVVGLSTTESSSGLPSAASLVSGTQAIQYSDSGTDDQDWVFYLLTDGNYLIKNHYSGLYLQDDGSNTSSSATIDQGARSSAVAGCTCQEWTLTKTTSKVYSSPLTVTGTGIYVHDPNMIQDPVTGVYWLYGTHQTIAYATSLSDTASNTFTYTTASTADGACGSSNANDQVGDDWLTLDAHCALIGPDFNSWTGLQLPKSDNNGGNTDIWAPSVMYANNKYYQYYSIPVEPDTVGGEAIIGLATSSTAFGPWTDQGWVTRSWSNTTNTPISGFGFVAGTTFNAIDPASYIDASGNWWLVYGSWFDGTHIIQLNTSTGLPSTTNTTITNAAFRYWGEEGPFIYPYVVNGTQYYYYFAPINPCCSATSTYRMIYGRSTSPTGPFLDRGGVNLESNGGTILMSTHDNIVGPGGQSVFTDTGASGTASLPTLVYHYYDGNNNGTPTLGINRIAFTTDGWPYIP